MSYLLGPEEPPISQTESEEALLALTDAAGLRERSGDWPKVAHRWREVLRASVRRVLVDLSAGDPLKAHQANLGWARPLALLEGLSAALRATRAQEAIFIVPSSRPHLPPALKDSLERGALGPIPFRVLPVRDDPVAALDESLAAATLGLAPVPTELPAGAAAAGIAVHRPETLLQLRHLLLVGPQEFSRHETFVAGIALGDGAPWLQELRLGTNLSQALRAAQKTAQEGDLVLLGSALSSPFRYLPDLPLAPDEAATRGAQLGGGGIRVMAREGPSLRAHVTSLAASSCGQCPSCVMAAGVIADRLQEADDAGIRRIARHARGKGLCPLLDALCDGAEAIGGCEA